MLDFGICHRIRLWMFGASHTFMNCFGAFIRYNDFGAPQKSMNGLDIQYVCEWFWCFPCLWMVFVLNSHTSMVSVLPIPMNSFGAPHTSMVLVLPMFMNGFGASHTFMNVFVHYIYEFWYIRSRLRMVWVLPISLLIVLVLPIRL